MFDVMPGDAQLALALNVSEDEARLIAAWVNWDVGTLNIMIEALYVPHGKVALLAVAMLTSSATEYKRTMS